MIGSERLYIPHSPHTVLPFVLPNPFGLIHLPNVVTSVQLNLKVKLYAATERVTARQRITFTFNEGSVHHYMYLNKIVSCLILNIVYLYSGLSVAS